MRSVTDASERVIGTSELAAVALVAVSAVAILALIVAVIALERTRDADR
jgi:hypothetical protein